MTRGTTTLIGAGVAGGLIWLASWIGHQDTNTDYWAAMGILAGAGLVMALSQLLGGWTKWGLPVVSPTVFLIGFLPVAVAAMWVIVAAQPDANEARTYAQDWAGAIGLQGSVLNVLTDLVTVVAFGLGLTFGFTFDTTGPRRDEEVVYERDHVAEEPITAERDYVGTGEPHVVPVGRETEVVGAGATRTTEPAGPPVATTETAARPRRRLFHRD